MLHYVTLANRNIRQVITIFRWLLKYSNQAVVATSPQLARVFPIKPYHVSVSLATWCAEYYDGAARKQDAK